MRCCQSEMAARVQPSTVTQVKVTFQWSELSPTLSMPKKRRKKNDIRIRILKHAWSCKATRILIHHVAGYTHAQANRSSIAFCSSSKKASLAYCNMSCTMQALTLETLTDNCQTRLSWHASACHGQMRLTEAGWPVPDSSAGEVQSLWQIS